MEFSSRDWYKYIFLLLLAGLLGWTMADSGVKLSVVLVLVPPIILFIIYCFQRPELVLHLTVMLAFMIAGLSRYVPGPPFGLAVDGLLVLLIVILIFHGKFQWKPAYFTNTLVLCLIGWVAFTFVELFNPLAKSKAAWFYANRGFSFYPLLLVITTFYVYRKPSQIQYFLIIWAVLSIFGTMWGIKQLMFGVSVVEKQWLNAGAASTHILFGKLRVFSYYSDAAQFGASQAHTALVFGILGLYGGQLKYRWLILGVSALSLYGMLISGTRGALAILAVGGLVYLLMTKNFKVLVAGLLFAVGVFVFLKYTTILQSNYQVNRLRTALNADDPSLKVRLEREKILSNYLADKPLGGGIGSAGYWGKRFTPGTFLAEIGTDGHYTRIWMECGIIGLYLYLAMLVVILFYLGRMIWKMPHSRDRQLLIAFLSGFAGVCAASYTNGLLTQIPTGALVFIGLALIWMKSKEANETSAEH